MTAPRLLPRSDVLAMFRRIGMSDAAERARAVLPDPVDLDRDAALLRSFGLDRDALVDRFGGSP